MYLTEKVCSTDPVKAFKTRIMPPLVEMRICFPLLLNLSPVQSQMRLNFVSNEAKGPCWQKRFHKWFIQIRHTRAKHYNTVFYLVVSTKVIQFNCLWFHPCSKYQPLRVKGTNRFPQWISQTLTSKHTQIKEKIWEVGSGSLDSSTIFKTQWSQDKC